MTEKELKKEEEIEEKTKTDEKIINTKKEPVSEEVEEKTIKKEVEAEAEVETETKTIKDETKEDENLLISNDDYLKAGIHIGTKFKTKYMKPFIYKTRPDGLSVLDIEGIDKRLRIAINMLSQYKPEEILVVSRRENGWKPIRLMSKLLGTKIFAGRYPPGVMTNPSLKNFIEVKVMLVVDAWPDRNAIADALKIGIPVVALCDTNNQSNNIDLVVPCNNKGKKSLGLVFWLLTKGIMEARGMTNKGQTFSHSIEDFTEE